MSRPTKGARIVWRDESRKPDGRLRNSAGWFIRDGSTFISTGCGDGDRQRAEQKLGEYISQKYQPQKERGRDPDSILIADVLNVYLQSKVPGQAKQQEAISRIKALISFFGDKHLSDINGDLCRAFASRLASQSLARRQLEDLRSAINHYHREGYVTTAPAVVLPPKPIPRDRWLTRNEAARLLWAAWTMKQSWKGKESDRRTGRHIARFILVGLYTGTRSSPICGAAVKPTPGHGFIDYERGVFYRKPQRKAETKKRQPPVKIPSRLLAHLRRWKDTDLEIKTKSRGKSANIGRKISHDFVVEWNGKSVTSVKKGFKSACEIAGLGWYEDGKFVTDVTPHVLRHTAATWLMQAGVDPWEASGFLGMTVETLINTYGHHHPDYQSEAAEKITSKRSSVVGITSEPKKNAPHRNPTETPETIVNKGDQTVRKTAEIRAFRRK